MTIAMINIIFTKIINDIKFKEDYLNFQLLYFQFLSKYFSIFLIFEFLNFLNFLILNDKLKH